MINFALVFLAIFPQIIENIYCISIKEIAYYSISNEKDIHATIFIYSIAFAVGILFFGKLSDKIGRKHALFIGIMLFFIGSFMMNYNDVNKLIVAKMIQGFGASVSVLTSAILSDSFNNKISNNTNSYITIAIGLSSVVVPIIKILFTTPYKIIDFINTVNFAIPICLICLFYRMENKIPENTKITFVNKNIVFKCATIVGIYIGIQIASYMIFNKITNNWYAEYIYSTIPTCICIGGILSYFFNKRQYKTIDIGMLIQLFGSMLLLLVSFFSIPFLSLITYCFVILGGSITVGNIITIAIRNFESNRGWCDGIFSFIYQCIASLTFYSLSLVNDMMFGLEIMLLVFVSLSMWVFKCVK